MTIAEILLQDFDPEMRSTRSILERIPDDKPAFKPHEKSMAWGRLATHVANLPRFGTMILTSDHLDLATTKFPPLTFESRAKLLSEFEATATEVRGHLAEATDEQLLRNWKLVWGPKVIADGSRLVIYRTMFFNHLIHHRSQLGVYLRLNNLPVPGLYGPSADDTMPA